MSDFFSRLAERSLGLAATAQPVFAPRFAVPATIEVETAAPPPASVTHQEPPNAVERETARPAPVAPKEIREVPALPETHALGERAPEPRPLRAAHESTPETAPTPAQIRPVRQATRLSASEPPAAEQEEKVVAVTFRNQPVAHDMTISELSIPRPVEVRTEEAAPRSPVPPQVPVEVAAVAARVKPPPAKPPAAIQATPPLVLPPSVTPPPSPTPPLRVPTPTALPGEPPRVQSAFEITEPASRDVHVHIGRIEVRAAPPPQQPSPRQRTTLSLGEYLKMRNGERQ